MGLSAARSHRANPEGGAAPLKTLRIAKRRSAKRGRASQVRVLPGSPFQVAERQGVGAFARCGRTS